MAQKQRKRKQKTRRPALYTVFPREKKAGAERLITTIICWPVVILLTCFGLVMLYSTQRLYSEKLNMALHMAFFGKQAVIMGLYFWHDGNIQSGLSLDCQLGNFVVTEFPIFSWFATKYVGEDVNGATRWIKLGPVQVPDGGDTQSWRLSFLFRHVM